MENEFSHARAAADAPQALFTPLGCHRRGNVMWFYFRACAGVRWFTSAALCRRGTALEIVPDAAHWLRIAPRRTADGKDFGTVDWTAIGALLIRLAIDAGPYRPAPEEAPRGPGRPPRAPK